MVDVCPLPSRSVIRLSGSEARPWLQGLITNDVDVLTPKTGLYAALLSPQGKILFDFFVYDTGSDLLIDCEEDQREALMKRLKLYKLRSDVDLIHEPSLGVVSSCTPVSSDEGLVLQVPDPRLDKLGIRILGDMEKITSHFKAEDIEIQAEAAYRGYLLKLGVPNKPADFPSNKSYPLESNFEALNGVSFSKGCFIGQEVTARTKHKTTLARRLLPLSVEGDMPGEEVDIRSGSQKVGTLLPGQDGFALGLIRLQEMKQAEAEGETLRAGDAIITINIPEWLTL